MRIRSGRLYRHISRIGPTPRLLMPTVPGYLRGLTPRAFQPVIDFCYVVYKTPLYQKLEPGLLGNPATVRDL